MQAPGEELPEYLETLINRFLNTKSIHQQLKELSEWRRPNRIEAFKMGSFFFRLAEYSMNRIVLIELAAFTSSEEDNSLVDWLEKARTHAGSLQPTRYIPRPRDERVEIEMDEYISIVQDHLDQLRENRELIDRIQNRRNESVAHFDSKFFGGDASVDEEYPIKVQEVSNLIDVIGEILREHHLYILDGDIKMHIHGRGSIDTVLDYVRAFQRIRQDYDLIEEGFRPRSYRGDDYE
jgi:hypothetical protein